MLYKATCVIRY